MFIKACRLCLIFAVAFLLNMIPGCKSQPNKQEEEVQKPYTHPCGCALSDEQMIMQCPVDAIDDSVIICKVGTNNVIGSNRPPMAWPEFIASEYFGGEGQLVDCKTGKPLLPDVKARKLSYKNKQLLVDERYRLDVYDPKNNKWIDFELPVWRNTISAINNELKISPDSLVFKPPFHGAEAFKVVAKEYEEEMKRTDHYMITRTVNRLLVCALSGDKLSEQRLLNLKKDFADYYSKHSDSEKFLEESLALHRAYSAYLAGGGKRVYDDLSGFVYFKDLPKRN